VAPAGVDNGVPVPQRWPQQGIELYFAQTMMHKPTDKPAAQPPPARAARRVIDNPWLILAMLFFVTAALGLPILWLSRGFSAPAKTILSIVVLAYTVVLLWAFWLFLVFMWNNYYAPYLR